MAIRQDTPFEYLPKVGLGPHRWGRSRAVRALGLGLCAALLVALGAAPASAAPGDPDPSFGVAGVRTFQPRGLEEPHVAAVAVQPDGKILVLGDTGSYHGQDHDIVVMRLEPDGSPDPSFGLGGTASIDFSRGGKNADDYAGGMALQSSGKIIVVGHSYTGTESGEGPENARATVARLNVNGTLDTTFGVGATDEWAPGELVAKLGIGASGGTCCDRGDGASAVVVRPDDRIVVVGETGTEPGEPPRGEMFALGLTADGARDESFGDYGRAFLDFGGADSARAAVLASNGDLILAGASYDGFVDNYAVARLSPSGTPVASFGSGGKRLLTAIGAGYLSDVAIQPDGKLVLAATEQGFEASSTTAGLIRLNPDGSTDSLNGHAFQPIPGSGRYDEAGSVAVDGAGRLLASAISYESAGKIAFRLTRFTPTGALDPTFGGTGSVVIPVGESISGWGFRTPRLALQPDGRVLLAGTANGLFDVRRFLGGTLETPPPGPGSSGPPGGGAKPRPPRVEILKSKVSAKHRRATFTFRASIPGSRFQCALVKAPKKKKKHPARAAFSSCHSPQTYSGLAAGRYTFEVRAVGAGGAGPAASKRFSV
ncbi:MAG TPA: hypothetical protein VF731_02735 [Solirubrobacterales bacterium]